MRFDTDGWHADPKRIEACALAVCHFDQEPIYQDSFMNLYDAVNISRVHRYPRLLANSERSHLKKTICKEHGLIDWYFFYHGFAALDWYRDAQYLDHDISITHPYISLNHLINHKRSYRMSMMARLWTKRLIDNGIVSFHGSRDSCLAELADTKSPLSDQSKKLIHLMIDSSQPLPILAHAGTVDGTSSAHFGHQEYDLRQRALFSVVNETVFFDQKLHLTEKIFQPIVCQRPFLLVAAAGNLDYLRSYGFKTFGDWIDESYDDEPDDDRRMDMIVGEIQKLCDLPLHVLRHMHADMRAVLTHNKRHFFGDFKTMIVDELVDNFDQCIRVWNNGRVDGRDWPMHPDLQSVKQIFLR